MWVTQCFDCHIMFMFYTFALRYRVQLIDDLSYEDVKKCYRGSVSRF